MIYILIRANKTAFVKSLSLIINSLNTSLQFQSTNLLLDLRTIDNFKYNKDLFIKKTYKEKPSYFETGSKEPILSKCIESILVFLQNKNGYQIELVLI